MLVACAYIVPLKALQIVRYINQMVQYVNWAIRRLFLFFFATEFSVKILIVSIFSRKYELPVVGTNYM